TAAQEQQEILDALGITEEPSNDPYYNDGVELLEFTQPKDEHCAWGIIGNQSKLITLNPQDYPHKSRMQPYSFYYNVPTPGAAVGISEYQQNGQLHELGDKMLMALADYSALQTLPALKHVKGLGMGSPITAPKPGAVLDLEEGETLEQVFDFSKPLSVSVQTIGYVKGDIDD